MANEVLGRDCCGDRYECNTTKRCRCGCKLTYCRTCYADHELYVLKKELAATKKALKLSRASGE